MALLFPSPLEPIIRFAPLIPNPNRLPPLVVLTSSKVPSISQKPPRNSPIVIQAASSSSSSSSTSSFTDFAIEVDALDGDAGSPWEGAVVYRRDASVAHLEYCTTLERLGLAKLSSGLSRSRASAMGIRLQSRRVRDSASGGEETPVLVSVDVTRRKRRLRLDGVVRTIITLGCNRCAEPAAECVFSNFSLLLTEDPIDEPDEINMGVMFGEDKYKNVTWTGNEEEEDDDKVIDLDDRLYFPAEEKEIDISKHIRDIVHVEITINAVCDASCKGLCLKCGKNLNKSSCNCSKETLEDIQYGPLKNLRKQMQQT